MNLKKYLPWHWIGKKDTARHANALPVNVKQGDVHPMQRIHLEMNQLFAGMLSGFEFQPLSSVTGLLQPQLTIQEKANQFLITVEVPGVDEKDIEISIDVDTLTIRGEQKHQYEEKKQGYHRIVQSYGMFQRVFTLPENADCEHIRAQFKKGVLTLKIDKLAKQAMRGQVVEIEKSA